MPRRTCYLVDGFNVYHSICEALDHSQYNYLKWLNLDSLCGSYLHVIGGGATLEGVHYFSALAKHLSSVNPGVVTRHSAYIAALESEGVEVHLGRFKKRSTKCYRCGHNFDKHEEKETDVAIAAKLLELVYDDICEVVVLVTGDTDLAPAIRTARQAAPDVEIWVAFPYRRHNAELEQLADNSFKIQPKQYNNHQFPDPVTLPDGRPAHKPQSW